MWILNILAGNLVIVFVVEILFGYIIGARSARKIITISLINVITNPVVVMSALCLTLFLREWQNIGVLCLELIVVYIEGLMFSKFEVFEEKNPYIISLVLNFASYVTGELINIFL